MTQRPSTLVMAERRPATLPAFAARFGGYRAAAPMRLVAGIVRERDASAEADLKNCPPNALGGLDSRRAAAIEYRSKHQIINRRHRA